MVLIGECRGIMAYIVLGKRDVEINTFTNFHKLSYFAMKAYVVVIIRSAFVMCSNTNNTDVIVDI